MRKLKIILAMLALVLFAAAPASAQATFDQAEPGEVRLAVGGANVEVDSGFFAGNTAEAAVGGFVAEADDEFLFFGEDFINDGFPF